MTCRPKLEMWIFACAVSTFTCFAVAADTPSTPNDAVQPLGEIVVIGSHIRGVDLETQHPVLIIDRAQIERTGLTSISDIVQSIVADGSSLNRSINNGGRNGEQLVNLRSLGFNRTLVLLNGQRFVSDISGAVDLSAIPIGMVERIEVLLDSASAIYGSDAIAGVINIVTRQNFEGGSLGIYHAQTDYDDGERRSYDLEFGHKGEGWSASGGLEWSRDDPIMAGNRTISAVPYFGVPLGATGSRYSGFSLLQPASGGGLLRLIDGRSGIAPNDFRPFSKSTDYDYNYALENYLQTPQSRRAVFAQARYELNPTLAVVTDALFNQRGSRLQLAPPNVHLVAADTGEPDAIAIAAGNLYNPFGEPIVATHRRFVEGGPRHFAETADTLRLHAGLDGAFSAFGRDFIWGADATQTHARLREFTGPYGDDRKLALAVGPSFRDANGTPRCGTPDAVSLDCVPLDLFGPPGSITQTMLDYVDAYEVNRERDTSRLVDAHVSSSQLFTLPDGALALAIGISHRKESAAQIVDPLKASGNENGNGNTFGSTQGAYSVTEEYLEVDAGLLADKAFARQLALTLGTRHSNYSNFGGTTNSQIGLRWMPSNDLLVRANYAQGFRAPAITDLFAGAAQSVSPDDPIDPCDPLNGEPPAVLARCAALGVPANLDSTQEVAHTVSRGNPHLQPETSRSRGVGVVFTPSWLDGLDASLDWYNIRLRNPIGDVGIQAVFDDCYLRNRDSACALITRNPVDGTLVQVIDMPTNVTGGTETEGYDMALRFRRATQIGRITVLWNVNYVDYFGELGQPKTGDVLPDGSIANGNLAGANFNADANGLFGVIWRVRSQLQLAWELNAFSASITGRYFSHITEDCGLVVSFAGKLHDPSLVGHLCSDPNATFLGEPDPLNRVPSVTFTDLEGSWVTPWRGRFTLGVRNVFDRDPPISHSAFANSFFPDYDIPGRFFYASYRQAF